MTAPLRILFAAGGTGGHVYPALAVADAVRRLRPDATIAFAGTAHRLEGTAVPKAGYVLHPVEAVALPRRLSADALRFPARLVRALLQSRRVVRNVRPDVAVGTGGYVTGPVLRAAAGAGVPVLIQEQNAFAGVTNRLLARLAREVHVAFEAAKDAFGDKAILSGNPVRASLTNATPAEGRAAFDLPDGVPVLVVTGGSLGAQRLNEAVAAHLAALLDGTDAHVVWIAGPRYYVRVATAVNEMPREIAARVHVVEYCEHMEMAYAAADLFVCRAGAITCSELALTGTPAVLVPSPLVAEDHQTHNARALADAGAAVLLPEPELDAAFVSTVRGLLASPERRAAMAAAARGLARPDAADAIARRVVALAEAHAASSASTAA